MPRRRPTPAPPADELARYEPQRANYFRVGWDLAHRAPQKAAVAATANVEPGTAQHARARGAALGLRSRARCEACGRELRDPTAVARRVGPDCWAKGHRTKHADRELAGSAQVTDEPGGAAPDALPAATVVEAIDGRRVDRYADLDAFYTEDLLGDLRHASGEVDYGATWRVGWGGTTARVSWVERTGEVYVYAPDGITEPVLGPEDTVKVIAVVPTRAELDTLLAGWGEHLADGLRFVLFRLRGWPARGPLAAQRVTAAIAHHDARMALVTP